MFQVSTDLSYNFSQSCLAQAPVTKDEQWKLTAEAKAKAKAKEEKSGKGNGEKKPQRKSRAKGKAKARATAKAKAKAVAKAKAKSRAAAKAKGKGKGKAKAKAAPRARATGKNPPISIDDVLQPLPPGVPEALGFPPAPPSPPKMPSASCTSLPGREKENAQPAKKRPSAKTSSRSKKAKTESGNAAPADSSSPAVKDLERKGLVPNTFGGRAKPSGGWALDKYARTAAAFKENIEAKLEPRTKNKAQAWIDHTFSSHTFKQEHRFDFDSISFIFKG